MLHVVLLAYYPFHCLFVGVERSVEVLVIFQSVGRILDACLKLVDAPLLLNGAQQGVVVKNFN